MCSRASWSCRSPGTTKSTTCSAAAAMPGTARAITSSSILSPFRRMSSVYSGERLTQAGEGGPEAASIVQQRAPLWYKDVVIYQLHIKAFFDSNNDGIGDFKGLASKLDYIQDLGVNAIWLLPFYPSPMKDDGYDVSDYHNVHPHYGARADFRDFVREAHRRGLKVITELVINHTSDQHPWFQAARRAPAGSR